MLKGEIEGLLGLSLKALKATTQTGASSTATEEAEEEDEEEEEEEEIISKKRRKKKNKVSKSKSKSKETPSTLFEDKRENNHSLSQEEEKAQQSKIKDKKTIDFGTFSTVVPLPLPLTDSGKSRLSSVATTVNTTTPFSVKSKATSFLASTAGPTSGNPYPSSHSTSDSYSNFCSNQYNNSFVGEEVRLFVQEEGEHTEFKDIEREGEQRNSTTYYQAFEIAPPPVALAASTKSRSKSNNMKASLLSHTSDGEYDNNNNNNDNNNNNNNNQYSINEDSSNGNGQGISNKKSSSYLNSLKNFFSCRGKLTSCWCQKQQSSRDYEQILDPDQQENNAQYLEGGISTATGNQRDNQVRHKQRSWWELLLHSSNSNSNSCCCSTRVARYSSSYNSSSLAPNYDHYRYSISTRIFTLLLIGCVAMERITFKATIDQMEPFRIFSAIFMSVVNTGLLYLIVQYKRSNSATIVEVDSTSVPNAAFPRFDVFVIAMLDSIQLYLMTITAGNTPPLLTILLIQAATPMGYLIRKTGCHPFPSSKPTTYQDLENENLASPQRIYYHNQMNFSHPNANSNSNSSIDTTLDDKYTTTTTASTPNKSVCSSFFKILSFSQYIEKQGQYIGSYFIAFGSLVALLVSLYASMDSKEILAFVNILVYFILCLFSSISSIYKERAILRYQYPISNFYLSYLISKYQIIIMILLSPLAYSLQGLGMDDFTSYYKIKYSSALRDSFTCLSSINFDNNININKEFSIPTYPETSPCNYALPSALLYSLSLSFTPLLLQLVLFKVNLDKANHMKEQKKEEQNIMSNQSSMGIDFHNNNNSSGGVQEASKLQGGQVEIDNGKESYKRPILFLSKHKNSSTGNILNSQTSDGSLGSNNVSLGSNYSQNSSQQIGQQPISVTSPPSVAALREIYSTNLTNRWSKSESERKRSNYLDNLDINTYLSPKVFFESNMYVYKCILLSFILATFILSIYSYYTLDDDEIEFGWVDSIQLNVGDVIGFLLIVIGLDIYYKQNSIKEDFVEIMTTAPLPDALIPKQKKKQPLKKADKKFKKKTSKKDGNSQEHLLSSSSENGTDTDSDD